MKFYGSALLFVMASGCTDENASRVSKYVVHGEPCSDHSACHSHECVPTIVHEEGSVGICWDEQFEGCALVDFEQWVVVDMCNARDLVVCQLQSTSEMQTMCAPPEGGSAPWIANLLCCDPSFI